MLTVRLAIGSTLEENAVDTQTLGLVYLSADNILGPELRELESESYPERDGEDILPYATFAPFDYKIKFFIKSGGSLGNANNIIERFNQSLYEDAELGGDEKRIKKVAFFNDYKKVKIVGYPLLIPTATEFWRDPNNTLNDIVVVEWTIRVSQPKDCDFNID